MIDILFTAIISSIACVGMYAAQDEGMLLNFMRKPLEDWNKRREGELQKELNRIELDEDNAIMNLMKQHGVSCCDGIDDTTGDYKFCRENLDMHYRLLIKEANKRAKRKAWIITVFKPISLCVHCFASVWGTSAYIIMHGFKTSNIDLMVLNIFLTVTITGFIYSKYAKHVG